MPLYVDPRIPRFTRSELVGEMQERFGDFTVGAFRDWQDRGLVATPRRDGRWSKGRVGSREALWSEHDRQMLIALLTKREERRSEINGQFSLPELAHFVVWSWIYWDDVIALEQAKRALKSWAKPQLAGKQRSKARLLQQAREAIAAVAAPDVGHRQQASLANRLANSLWTGDLAGVRSLTGDLAAIVDPEGAGRRIGAPGATATADTEIQRMVWGHLGVRAIVLDEPKLSDGDLLAVRQLMRAGWSDYQREWVDLRATASDPNLFSAPDIALQISRCAPLFLTLLGGRVERQYAAQVS